MLRIGALTENSGCEENASKYSRSIRIRAETRSTAQGSIPFPRSISSFDYLPVEKRSYGVRPANADEEKNISSVSVQFEKHQPERRRGGEGYLLCGGGCCCCSCCLHSLGGLIGAAAAPLRVGDSAPEFRLLDQNDHVVRLSAARGHKVVLVFYRGFW